MAAPDDTALKALIDSNIPDANPGLPRRATAAFVRATLKALVDWVKTGINNNLSTWLRSSDNTPGGGNAETVYRTGLTIFKGNVHSYGTAATGSNFSAVSLGQGGMQVIGSGPGGAAFIEFHIPNIVIQQFGVDTDGQLKYRNSSGAPKRVVIDTITADFALAQTSGNRKIVMYDEGGDHKFYGFGVDSGGWVRYQTSNTGHDHVFYAADSYVSSIELMRIKGNGRVGIGTSAPDALLDLGGGVGIKQLIYGNGGDNGYKSGFGTGLGTAPNTMAAVIGPPAGNGVAGDGSFSVVSATTSWPYTAYTTRFTVLSSGNVGIGTIAPTSILHLKGATGHQQLRLDTSYTPTGTADANGAVGQICWSDSYFYVKTTAGWKRSALTTW